MIIDKMSWIGIKGSETKIKCRYKSHVILKPSVIFIKSLVEGHLVRCLYMYIV
jgi:hypothetical protein